MNLIRQPLAFAALLLCCLAGARAAQPVTNVTKRPQPDRWLLIVDTSAAMERRAKAMEGVAGELLASGMNGQMQPGSELGIWTYNKELYAGVAPVQTWEPAGASLMVSRTVAFLGRQEYRGKSQPEAALAELARVVGDSRKLTVVWFSDGTKKITGTPFDSAINAAYTNQRPALAKNRMPLVTVLRVYHGKYIGQSVSVAPWPVEFPAFPVEPEKTNAPAPPELAAAKPAAPVKSIYISREPEPAEVVAPGSIAIKGGDIKLRPLPDSVGAEVPPVPVSKPVETMPPPPIAVPEPTPVVAPIEPAPSNKPAAPAPTVVALAEALPAIPPAPTPKVSSPASAVPLSPPALATDTVTARKWPLILGIACLSVAIVAALVLARRSRRSHATSLITRSFDRDQK